MAEASTTAPRETGTGAGGMFQLLRDGRPRTRSELAMLTGQARSTVATRIDALMGIGFVRQAGEATSTGGRPPATFAFDPSAQVVLGVDLSVTHARLAVTDLASTVLAEVDVPLAIADGPHLGLDQIAKAGSALITSTGRCIDDLAGVGVGLPGPVEHATGRPHHPPIMPGWDDADVPGILGSRLGAPVLVDNDVNVMALGEHRLAWPEVPDLLLIKVATGIGAGIISDGALRRGAQGAAGDIGHVAVPGVAGVLCHCGNDDCLESVAGAAAVTEGLRAQGIDATTPRDVVAALRAGNVAATRVVRQAGRETGAVLAAAVSLLNPSVIVIGGLLADVGEHLIAGIREVVYQRSLPLATEHLRIVTARTGDRASVLGAASMAADHVLSPESVDGQTENARPRTSARPTATSSMVRLP